MISADTEWHIFVVFIVCIFAEILRVYFRTEVITLERFVVNSKNIFIYFYRLFRDVLSKFCCLLRNFFLSDNDDDV